jgi:hypothetical protein
MIHKRVVSVVLDSMSCLLCVSTGIGCMLLVWGSERIEWVRNIEDKSNNDESAVFVGTENDQGTN